MREFLDINEPPEFEHSSHTYYVRKKSNIYTSATQIVGHFCNEFDTEERAQYMTYRYGQTPEYWRAQWKDINHTSLHRGDKKHQAEEDFLYGRGYSGVNGKIFPVNNYSLYKVPEVVDFQYKGYKSPSCTSRQIPAPYHLLPDGTYPELMFWRHDYKIAGRADKPTFETIGDNRYLHIEDYKTNARIRKESHYTGKYPNGTYQMMLGPLQHLMDCEWYHYALQLSLYQFMGEYFGFKPGVRRIIHFPHEIEGLGTPDPIPYELPYLRDEVIAMLEHLNLNRA